MVPALQTLYQPALSSLFQIPRFCSEAIHKIISAISQIFNNLYRCLTRSEKPQNLWDCQPSTVSCTQVSLLAKRELQFLPPSQMQGITATQLQDLNDSVKLSSAQIDALSTPEKLPFMNDSLLRLVKPQYINAWFDHIIEKNETISDFIKLLTQTQIQGLKDQ